MAQRIPVQQLLSDRARAYILARWIDTGAGWVDALPQRVEDLLRDWDLDFVESLSGGRSCVLSVRTAEGEPGVLKVAVVDRWALREAIALRHWSSTRHAPSVRRVGDGALVLEHVAGRPLSRSDRDLLPAAAQMLAAAARNDSPPPGIPRLDPQRTMAVAARQAAGRLPERWAVNAAERASQLLQEAPAVLCHADLVPSNLLATARGMVKNSSIPSRAWRR